MGNRGPLSQAVHPPSTGLEGLWEGGSSAKGCKGIARRRAAERKSEVTVREINRLLYPATPSGLLGQSPLLDCNRAGSNRNSGLVGNCGDHLLLAFLSAK